MATICWFLGSWICLGSLKQAWNVWSRVESDQKILQHSLWYCWSRQHLVYEKYYVSIYVGQMIWWQFDCSQATPLVKSVSLRNSGSHKNRGPKGIFSEAPETPDSSTVSLSRISMCWELWACPLAWSHSYLSRVIVDRVRFALTAMATLVSPLSGSSHIYTSRCNHALICAMATSKPSTGSPTQSVWFDMSLEWGHEECWDGQTWRPYVMVTSVLILNGA